ncbi:MAG: hypothetical protein ACO3DJ_19370, partial [Alphaproteobacteria bacterium]
MPASRISACARSMRAARSASPIGGAAGEFTYSPRFGNWGLSFTRAKTDLRINWNYRGRQRGNAVTGGGIGPGTFNWNPERTYIDLSGEFAAWK